MPSREHSHGIPAAEEDASRSVGARSSLEGFQGKALPPTPASMEPAPPGGGLLPPNPNC